MSAEQEHEGTPSSPEIHFEPIVTLAKVDIKTLEENEEELIKMRAKLFRYIIGQHDTAPEWKERGVGDVKILKNRTKTSYRLVMRREKTLKVCANHFLNKDMELKPNCGSDRAWVWNVSADYADEEPRKETLAIRFANAENAMKFKDVFDKCKEKLELPISDEESEKLANELESLKVAEKPETEQGDKQNENGQEDSKEDESKKETDTQTASDKIPESSEKEIEEPQGQKETDTECKTETETPSDQPTESQGQ